MARRISIGAISTSSSLQDSSRELAAESYLRWDNLKNFLYLSEAFSNTNFNFDIFSGTIQDVTIYSFIFVQMTVGMSYMFMDSFIKLYTGKVDVNKTLNPLLKGVAYGALLQTLLWSLIHANDLADAINYFINSLKLTPPWSICKSDKTSYWVETKTIIKKCMMHLHRKTHINVTCAHNHYMNVFMKYDRSSLTIKSFVVAMVWIIIFLFTSVSDLTLIKLFKLMYFLRLTTLWFTAGFIMMSETDYVSVATSNIMNITAPVSITDTFAQVAYIYGIGIVGVYDFGTLSPYTCVDNAVLLFSVCFTINAFVRSLVTRILYLVAKNCIEVDFRKMETVDDFHYLLFVLLPLSSENIKASKVFSLYLYFNMILTLCGHLAAFTLTMSKTLHSEFKAIKNVYLVGIISFCGFLLSLPVAIGADYFRGIVNGLNLTMFYLGALRMAIIMYIYGMKKFSTDIQFWLNFKPTRYWRTCWSLTPVILTYVMALKLSKLLQDTFGLTNIPAFIWYGFSIAFVTMIQLKTIINYIMDNNLTAAFRSSPKYGPPDIDERKKRRKYDETVNLRICRHNCILLDDKFDCNHVPLLRKKGTEDADNDGMTPIFEAGASGKINLQRT